MRSLRGTNKERRRPDDIGQPAVRMHWKARTVDCVYSLVAIGYELIGMYCQIMWKEIF